MNLGKGGKLFSGITKDTQFNAAASASKTLIQKSSQDSCMWNHNSALSFHLNQLCAWTLKNHMHTLWRWTEKGDLTCHDDRSVFSFTNRRTDFNLSSKPNWGERTDVCGFFFVFFLWSATSLSLCSSTGHRPSYRYMHTCQWNNRLCIFMCDFD